MKQWKENSEITFQQLKSQKQPQLAAIRNPFRCRPVKWKNFTKLILSECIDFFGTFVFAEIAFEKRCGKSGHQGGKTAP
jgi:hypothetical protein